MMRALVGGLLLVLAAMAPAQAAETIRNFDVSITVEADGDIRVTERIDLTVEGREIRRGIFRVLPRFYQTGEGERFKYLYKDLKVRRDGSREDVSTIYEGNTVTWQIGDADVLLPHGPHVYEISYLVKNQIRYFDGHDELYWNATGNYWNFPIEAASASVTLPDGAPIRELNAYTGAYGDAGQAWTSQTTAEGVIFRTTQPMTRGQGLTISVSMPKGVIEPFSSADMAQLDWQRYGAMGILGAGMLGIFGYYYTMWRRVGVDPAKLPVFPRYEPPEGYSPAAAHHVYFRKFRSQDALTASIMNLAVKGDWTIDVDDDKTTTLKRGATDSALSAEEDSLKSGLMALGDGDSVSFGGKYDSGFAAVTTRFQKNISKRYGAPYFRWNTGYVLLGAVLSFACVVAAVLAIVNWSAWHLWLILALAALNLAFLYFMPAPTRKGRETRSAIAGFRLYLETAEKGRLNAAEVGSGQPPPMSKELYERFLPYAVALNVEKPWTRHFEKVLPKEAADYHPAWGHFGNRGIHSIGDMNKAIVSGVAAGVATAATAPSSSSGGGGGGFSGGGGGGGGGGGW